MKFHRIYLLKEIAKIIECNYVGDENFKISGINEIHIVENGDIVFVDHPKYYDKALNSKASVILIDKEIDCPKGKTFLISKNPFDDFNKLIRYFRPFKPLTQEISQSAKVSESAIISPNVVVGNNVVIGDNTIIHPNVVIYDDSVIGNNVIIQSGTVVGSNAFYYKKKNSGLDRLLSGGNVVIENYVDIGAGCTIDKGVTGSTIIKEGTKIDNQVHIGHDTVIGKKCLIAAQVGIAGCSILENNVTFWGQVGMTSGAKVGENTTVLAQSGISKSLDSNKVYWGYPAGESQKKLKELVALRRLLK